MAVSPWKLERRGSYKLCWHKNEGNSGAWPPVNTCQDHWFSFSECSYSPNYRIQIFWRKPYWLFQELFDDMLHYDYDCDYDNDMLHYVLTYYRCIHWILFINVIQLLQISFALTFHDWMCVHIFLASQDAIEVMWVTYSLSDRSHWLDWCDPGEWWYL